MAKPSAALSASEQQWAELLKNLCDRYLSGEVWDHQDRRDVHYLAGLLIDRARNRSHGEPDRTLRELLGRQPLRREGQRGQGRERQQQ